MENLITNLDDVLKMVQKLRSNYLKLKSENESLEIQLSNLKVEADHYKSQLEKIKSEQEEKVEVDTKTKLSTSENPTNHLTTNMDESSKNATIEQVKLQLEGFIEDIDQCIQIIQTK